MTKPEPPEVRKVYAYMNAFGRVLEAAEFERMSADPRTQWVILTHWANAIKLGEIQ